MAVARVMVRHPRHTLYEALFERGVPELGRRLHGLPDERAMGYLDTYDVILPISRFSASWLQRYWGRGGEILYPPVDVAQFVPRAERRQVILGVGRFFRGEGHAKRHDAMIRTFRELVAGGAHGVGAAPRRGVDAGGPPPAVPPGVPAPGAGAAGAVPRRRPAGRS